MALAHVMANTSARLRQPHLLLTGHMRRRQVPAQVPDGVVCAGPPRTANPAAVQAQTPQPGLDQLQRALALCGWLWG